MRPLFSLAVGAVALFSATRPDTAPDEAPVVVAARCPRLVVRAAGPLPAACTRLEGGDIGKLPLVVKAGAQQVVIDEWAARDVSGRELIGFAAELPGDVAYVVRAGDSTYADISPRWLNPAGVVGPRSQPISQLTFCHVPRRVDGCPAALEVE